VTLSNFSTLIGVAGKMKYIQQDAIRKVLEWNKDPPGWGKKMGLE